MNDTEKNQSSLIASAFPSLLLVATVISLFKVGVVSAIMLFFGGLLCWYGSYAFLSSIIYSQRLKRILLPLVQIPVAYAGYFLLSKASIEFILFGFVVEDFQFAYFSLVMGVLMALTTKPYAHEIEYARSKRF